MVSISEQVLHRNVQRFRGGLAFKAHRFLYHSTLGLRVIKKKKGGLVLDLGRPGFFRLVLCEEFPRDFLQVFFLDPIDPSFRALSGRLDCTVRRHKFDKNYLLRGDTTSHQNRIKSPCPCPCFALALARVRRLLVQIKAIKKDDLIPL
jgi:hypothetical protein